MGGLEGAGPVARVEAARLAADAEAVAPRPNGPVGERVRVMTVPVPHVPAPQAAPGVARTMGP